MNVKNIIDEISVRAFAYSFLQGINDLYDAKEYENIESDYQNAFNHLLTILSDDLPESLNLMEGAYTECRYYAAQYGFKCGIFGAFRHFIGCTSDENETDPRRILYRSYCFLHVQDVHLRRLFIVTCSPFCRISQFPCASFANSKPYTPSPLSDV